jgi:hypothetical protein
MNDHVAYLMILGGASVVILAMAQVGLGRHAAPGDPAVRARLSLLSGASFLCAFGALAAALASVMTAELAGQGDVLGLRSWDIRDLRVASEILRFSALLPALGALAFGLAARGAIRESQGELRGRALYRTAVMIALLVGFAAFANPLV